MYRKTELENGIRVVTETMTGVRSCSMGFLFDASPKDEPVHKEGLAHLVEHLMFQGTSNRDAVQIARVMDMAGGDMGGFTTRDYTCYYATVLDDYLPYAMDLFGDLLLNSIFPDDHLEREKNAILREMAIHADVPDTQVHNRLKEFCWPNHPLGRSIAGFPESIQQMSREDVIYFAHNQYLPDRLVIAAAGNVDHEDFVAQVRDAFWRMLGQSPVRPCQRPNWHSGFTFEVRDVSQAYFCFGIPTLPYAHPDRHMVYVLNTLLGGGISSRLFRQIREERGLVYSIVSEYHAYRDAGMWVIEGSTLPELLPEVIERTLDELEKLIYEPIDAEDLWRSKMHLRGQHLLASESSNTRMSRLATQEFYFGQVIDGNTILSEIDAVDRLQLQAFTENKLASALKQIGLAVLGPEDMVGQQDIVANLVQRFELSQSVV